MITEVAVAVGPLENTTYTYDGPQGTTSALVITSPSSYAGQSIVLVLMLFICFVAFFANLAMLISLLLYKQAAKNTVNIFVCNQTILDLVSAFITAVMLILRMSGYYKYTKTGVLRTFSR